MNRWPSSPIEGLIFDIGDILYDASVWRRWLAETLRSEGIQITYPELVARWEALLVDVYRGQVPYWDRFVMLLRDVGVDEEGIPEISGSARKKALEVQSTRLPMPGVRETLRELRENGVGLCGLSDTESGERQVRQILRQLGVEEFFHAVVTSADIGVVKPDPHAYASAAAALELDLERCAFVGHDIDELAGARQTGLFAIAFNYHPDAPADVYLEDFAELTEILSNTKLKQE